MSETSELPVFDVDQRLPGRMHFPARMTVLPLGDRKLALISPVPIDQRMASEIARLGEVTFLIVPNLYHHLYLAPAIARYPQARVLAPPGFTEKRPDIHVHGTLDVEQPELAAQVDVIAVEGAPAMREFVFFHRASATLVVTDLVFNIERPRGLVTNLLLLLGGTRGRLAASRLWSLIVKDRGSAQRSIERVLALPVRTLVMAHGTIVRRDARARLAAALQARFLRRARPTPTLSALC